MFAFLFFKFLLLRLKQLKNEREERRLNYILDK